jgi:hypothetical protein
MTRQLIGAALAVLATSCVDPYIAHLKKDRVAIDYRPQAGAGHNTAWWPQVKDSFETFVRDHPVAGSIRFLATGHSGANGKTVFDRKVEKDLRTLMKWAAVDNDRTMLFGAEVHVRVN